jgi:hypothetical protein
MSGRIGTCTFKVGPNEQIDAIAQLPKETRSCIFGTVVDENNRPIADAVVKLLEVTKKGCFPVPLTHTFTDEFGQFLLGPLCPNRVYMLKIYSDNVNIVDKVLKLNCHKGSCIGVNSKCE